MHTWRPEKGVRCLGAEVTGDCQLSYCVCWELNSGLLQEYCMFLTAGLSGQPSPPFEW